MGAPTDQAQSTVVLRAGTVLGDRYRLVEPCGAGAMGSVWRARHVDLGSSVAIKFLHPEIAETKEGRARFEREARLAARLAEKCRYVARVIDYGVVEEIGPYHVMELLEGEELAERLKRDKRIPLALAAVIVHQLCRALEVAHAAGIVHRDVKPQNVFLARPHTNMTVFVKLMDFGVAKLMEANEPGEGLTRVGMVVGTPAYMSPEQLLAQPVDARSDLWSVAALVYRIVTGELPFGGGNLQETGTHIVTRDPVPPSELVPGLPPAFDEWMRRGLAKSAEARFQSARELAEELQNVAAEEPMPFAHHPSPPPDSGLRRVTTTNIRTPEPEPVTLRETIGERALERTHSGGRKVRRPLRLAIVALATALCASAAVTTISSPQATVSLGDALATAPVVVQPPASSAVVEPAPMPSTSASVDAKKPRSKSKPAK